MPVRRSKPNVDSFEIQRGYDLALQINFWFFEAFPTRSVVQGQKKPKITTADKWVREGRVNIC